MTNWTDTTPSDPIADLLAWQKAVAANTGLQSTRYVMSQAQLEQYLEIRRRHAALKASLRSTLRRRVIKRYKLRRQLGEKRLSILVPWPRFHRAKSAVRMRWIEFKHRNDPWWY